MKQRILVMNGQRIVQHEQGGDWKIDNVEKARLVKPGIYNLYLATLPDKEKNYTGPILHIKDKFIYQQVGKKYIKHSADDFDIIPEIGCHSSIKYDHGKAVVSVASMKIAKTMSR